MTRLFAAVAALLIVLGAGRSQAQIQLLPEIKVQPSIADWIYRPGPQRWEIVGSRSEPPFENGQALDLALGSDLLPVLATGYGPMLRLKKWNGQAWSSLNERRVDREAVIAIKMASSGGTIFIAVHAINLDGRDRARFTVYQLDGSDLVQLGPSFPVWAEGHAVAFTSGRPVVAWLADGSVVVHQWNGKSWDRLGRDVNDRPIEASDARSPSLAVTADGKIAVAYTSGRGLSSEISVKVWRGVRWTALGEGIPPPSRSPSLGGGNSSAAVAFLNDGVPEVSMWNGSTWSAAYQPCHPPRQGRNFGAPTLTIRAGRLGARWPMPDQPMLLCGIATRPNLGSRELVARIWIPGSGWEALGIGSINGEIALAERDDPAFVMKSDWSGRPWVAWAARGRRADSSPKIFVSTLVPATAQKPLQRFR